MTEYPLYDKYQQCPTARYVGGVSKYLCECSKPSQCKGIIATQSKSNGTVKNCCAKTVDKEHAYEVWSNGSWTWYVLKKYQTPEKEASNEYARWFCLVVSPMTGERGDMGDVYVSEVKRNARRIK